MNRLTISGILLGFGALAMAQDLDKKITIDIPASRASVALKELSKAAGITLEPAANLKDEVFVVHAVDATVQEIMDRIARAESGRWSQQSGIYLLVRDSSTTVAQERTELRARSKAIENAIAKLGERLKKNSSFDEASAQKLTDEQKRLTEQIQSGNPGRGLRLNIDPGDTPTGRAIARVLASIDPAKLAQIGMHQRVVFSTRPTNMQFGLGADGARAFETFIQEQLLYSRVYNQGEPQDGSRRVMMFNGIGTPNMGDGDATRGLGLGLVVVQRRFGSALNVDILAADPDYETISSGSYTLQLNQPQPADAKAGSPEKPLPLSPDSKELAQALGGGVGTSGGGAATTFIAVGSSNGSGPSFVASGRGGDRNPVKLSPQLREKILHPEEYEPLSFVPGEAMLALAKERSKNLVALLPDTCYSSLTRQFASDVTASQLLSSMQSMHGLQVDDQDGWMVVSPVAPNAGRAAKVDRATIGSLIRRMDHDQALPLDAVAAYALSLSKTPDINDIDMIYPRLIDATLTNEALAPLATGSLSLYKFYGMLTPSDRQAIAAGKQLSLGAMAPNLRELVADMLYNSPQDPSVKLPEKPGQDRRSYSITSVEVAGGGPGAFVFGGALSAKTERTIMLPNGVPGNGYLEGTTKNDQIAQALNSQTQARAFLDPGSLALSRSAELQSAISGFTPAQYDQFRIGRRITFAINFHLRPDVMMSRSLSDTSADQGVAFGPYDSLPGDFRAKVAAMEQNLKNAFDKVPGGTQRTPPP